MKKPTKSPLAKSASIIFGSVRNLFSLRSETDAEGTIESISKGIEFSGRNVWLLMLAILIASIGLNTNSTAVIIGAMLISPLMGPIMGAGLALGIYDFNLLKRSLRNLLVMTGISLAVSTIYFLASPLHDAQSELLSRSWPTIYDVLIAFFGGATGIVMGSRKDRISNALPGVAIATALMPPLCTVGFGIANGSIAQILGGFYLFLINSAFIALATLIFVRYLKFAHAESVTIERQRAIKQGITVASILLIIPSLIMGYDVVADSLFKRKARSFVESNFVFDRTRVINLELSRKRGQKRIEVTLAGEPLTPEVREHMQRMLTPYGLSGSKLDLIQNDPASSGVAQSLKAKGGPDATAHALMQEQRIRELEAQLSLHQSPRTMLPRLAREVSILFPRLDSISYGDMLLADSLSAAPGTNSTFIVRWKPGSDEGERKRLEWFLKARLNLGSIKVIEER